MVNNCSIIANSTETMAIKKSMSNDFVVKSILNKLKKVPIYAMLM